MTTTVSPSAATRPRLPAWARVLLTLVAFLVAGLWATPVLLVPAVDRAWNGADEWARLAVQSLAAVLTLAGYVAVTWVLVRGVDRRRFSALGMRVTRRAAVALGAGLAVAVVVGVGWAQVAQWLGWTPAGPPLDVAQELAGDRAVVFVLQTLVLAFVLQGVGEELLFRGYLLSSLAARPQLAVWVSAATFTVPHLLSSGGQQNLLDHLLYLATPFGFAVCAGYLAVALRSTWAAVGVHAGVHVASAIGAVLGLADGGVAIWLGTGVLFLAVGAVIGRGIPRGRWTEVAVAGPYADPGRDAPAVES